jgi:hypothetical protein
MQSGNLNLVPADDLLTLEREPSDSAKSAMHDDAFFVQQQKSQRLNAYYDQVVAELLTLLNESPEESDQETESNQETLAPH